MQTRIDNKQNFFDFAERWAKTFPPSRPFSGDLEVYKQLIKKYRNHDSLTKILILGATPELRDLASRFYTKMTVVDVNKNMVESLTTLRRYRTPEKVVIQPWQKFTCEEKQDIVLGDASLNMLNQSDIPRVIQKVSQALKSKGYFFHRTLLYSPKKNIKLMKVIKDWRDRKIYIGDARWLIEMYSRCKSYNPLTQIDDRAVFIENIKKLYFEGLITKAEFNKFGRYDDKVKMTILEKAKWEYYFSQHFKIKKIITPRGHLYCKDMPIFVCQKIN